MTVSRQHEHRLLQGSLFILEQMSFTNVSTPSPSSKNLRVEMGGARFMSGLQEMEGGMVTTVPVMATAAVYTPLPSAALRGMEVIQITWSSVHP